MRELSVGLSAVRAAVRVTCFDIGDPSNKMPALFNPNTLKQHYKAVVGKGSPVGWSIQIKQYSHTEDSPFTLQFYFSTNQSRRLGENDYVKANTAIAWYNQFVFARELGTAPPLMFLDWPNTLSMLVCVEEVETSYDLWDWYLRVRICTITLTVSEMRKDFRRQRDMHRDGFIDPGLALVFGDFSGGGKSGSSLSLGSGNRSGGK